MVLNDSRIRFSVSRRFLQPLMAAALLWSVAGAARGDVQIEGDRLTVTTQHLIAVFRGPDLIRLTNRLTGEQYVHAAPPYRSMIDMKLIEPTGKPLRWTEWRQGNVAGGANPQAAMTSLNDLTRTIWMSVNAEPETQDIVIVLWGDSHVDGVMGLMWGLHGLDLTSGRLILPAQGGRYADRDTMPSSLTLDYPTQWEAQMVIWEGHGGGFVVYTRDDQCLFKKLHMTRRADYADLGFETEAVAPWTKANDVPQMEWRLNAFRGDWRVPASGYRNLMRFLRPPVAAKGGREWVKNIRTVTTIHGDRYDPALPDALAKKLDPKKTLLYLPGWRRDGYDVNYPDYTPGETVRPFVERAHALGFHVMLHTDLPGVTPTNPDYALVRKYQVKDPYGKTLLGWYWDHPESDRNRFAFIDPASKAYRDLFIRRLRPMIEEIQPDAIHLDVSGPMMNDGNGLIEGKNYAQGSVALHRALLSAFPDLVLGGESVNELTAPFTWFAQRWNFGSLPPHPISDFLFGDHVLSYGYLGQPNPDQSPAGFLSYFSLYEGQGVCPTPVLSSAADLADDRPGMARLLKQVRAWQDQDFMPDWAGDWTGMVFRWRGDAGAAAVLEKAGPGVLLKVGEEVLYQRVRGANQVVSAQYIPGWPAYDDTTLFGLDPDREYWLESRPRPKDVPHLSGLSRGVVLTGAQVTPDFALFELSALDRTAADLLKLVPQAKTGTTYTYSEGPRDEPLEKGATADMTEMQAGGEMRKALFEHPPFQGRPGGETFVEFTLAVPETPHPALAYAVGISDMAGPTDGVTFRITVEGKEVWREHILKGGWQPGRIDLTAWSGRTIRLRLITHPGPKDDATFDHAGWSAVRLLAEANVANAAAKVSLPSGATEAACFCSGGTSVRNGDAVDFKDISLPGRVCVFLKPGQAVTLPQNLLDLPHDSSLVSAGIAATGSVYGSGTFGDATCGGVKKTRVLNAHTPGQGQTVFSWTAHLPKTEKLSLSFSAGLGDGTQTGGVGFAVRVNGETLWSRATRESGWYDGSVDLSRWRDQNVLIQLVTDSMGDNSFDWAKWADVIVK
jgi:hypothetical protein